MNPSNPFADIQFTDYNSENNQSPMPPAEQSPAEPTAGQPTPTESTPTEEQPPTTAEQGLEEQPPTTAEQGSERQPPEQTAFDFPEDLQGQNINIVSGRLLPDVLEQYSNLRIRGRINPELIFGQRVESISTPAVASTSSAAQQTTRRKTSSLAPGVRVQTETSSTAGSQASTRSRTSSTLSTSMAGKSTRKFDFNEMFKQKKQKRK